MIDFQNGSVIKLKKTDSIPDKLEDIFIDGESLIGLYKGIRDYVAFTNKRIISVNVQGMTGKKKDFTSMPYSKIQVFSIETSGVFDLDSELELYFSGVGKVKFEFSGASDIVEISKLIAKFIL